MMQQAWRRGFAPFLAILMLGVLTPPAAAGIRGQVDQAIRGASIGGASVAVSIRDGATGASIVAVNESTPMIPASNMKLLTTGAALHLLGPDFEFTTRLKRDGDRLIIIGDGDPAFGDPHLLEIMDLGNGPGVDIEEFLNLWIQPVREAQIDTVREVIVDDRIFDRDFAHEGWPADQLNRRYCAQVAGLNFHLNVLHFYPRPRSGGRPDVSRFEPHASWLDVGNSATSRAGAEDSNTAWIAREIGTNRLRFYGNVKFEYRTPVPVTVHDMPAFFSRLFAERLAGAGVAVESWRVAGIDEPNFEGELLGPVIATPISTIVERCNRDSQNLYAEALLKRCGAEYTQTPGSWTNGAAIMRHAVHDRLGSAALAASVTFDDGSGLSRGNRVSAATLTAWLNTFNEDDETGLIFIDSLAEPGGTGTLRRRFGGVNLHGAHVQAKSGYINGVSCLSGYVTMPDGRRRTFSVLINDLPGRATLRHARNLQEQIVAIIAEDMAASAVQLGSD